MTRNIRLIAVGVCALIVLVVGLTEATATSPPAVALLIANPPASNWTLAGPIQQMTGEFWTIQGVAVRVDASTHIQSDVSISTGTVVEARGIVAPGGALVATEVTTRPLTPSALAALAANAAPIQSVSLVGGAAVPQTPAPSPRASAVASQTPTALASVTASPSPPPSSATASPTPLVVVYRLVQAATGRHRFTSSATERQQLLKTGWANEQTCCRLFDPAHPPAGTVPLYRLQSSTLGDQLLTASPVERGVLEKRGYVADPALGNCYPTRPDSVAVVALDRLSNASSGDRLVTIGAAERDRALRLGYRDDGVLCYLLPPG